MKALDGWRPCGAITLREMRVGETRIFPAATVNARADAMSTAARIGCEITTRKLILVDPVSGLSQPVLAVTKLTACKPPKGPGGREISD